MIDPIAARLKQVGIAEPRREARLLIKAVTGTDPLLSDAVMNDALETAVAKRCLRIPLSKIVGRREFYGRDFIVNEHVLDPRPDSETLIDAALTVVKAGDHILDLGTGSGCLILTLLAERPGMTGMAVDISEDALAVARRNNAALGLHAAFVEADLAAFTPSAPADVLISNPPYIPHAEIAALEPEVTRYDPMLALDGGADGCDPYRAIFSRLSSLLKPGGHFLVELSPDICDKVLELARAANASEVRVIPDLAGRSRVITGICG